MEPKLIAHNNSPSALIATTSPAAVLTYTLLSASRMILTPVAPRSYTMLSLPSAVSYLYKVPLAFTAYKNPFSLSTARVVPIPSVTVTFQIIPSVFIAKIPLRPLSKIYAILFESITGLPTPLMLVSLNTVAPVAILTILNPLTVFAYMYPCLSNDGEAFIA